MAPQSLRLLLLPYPRWFRKTFERDLARYLDLQRAEPRYRDRPLGTVRFWWDAGQDALVTGLKLRLGRARERGRRLLGTRPASRAAHPGGAPERGGLAAIFEAIGRDLRDALRGISHNPVYTAVFVVTLGLGLGVNAAMFSAVNGALLRPLPHENGDRLVYLRHSAPLAGIDNVLFSVPEIDDYRRGAASLEAVAEFSAMTFTMLGYEDPRQVRAGVVTGNYFEVMGLSATVGRTIDRRDDGPGAPAVMVASDAYWRSVLGADPEIVGKTVEMNGRSATFVGVAEAAPPYPERTDIYTNMAASPHHLDASMNHDRQHRMTEVFARLAPAGTVDSVRAEVGGISGRLHERHPEAYDPRSGFEVGVVPLKTQLAARSRTILLMLFATSLLVLAIACANLANLTLARVLRREHELAVRASLGATRASLRRGLLVESLLLAALGTGLGLAMASIGLDVLVAFASRYTPRAAEIRLDVTVLGFASVAAVTASLFFAFLPPLGRDQAAGALGGGNARSTTGSRSVRAQHALVVGQIGMSFVLLIGAGLLLRTMLHLSRIDPGFETTRILTMDIPPKDGWGGEMTGEALEALRGTHLAMLEDVEAVVGVERAALTSWVPLSDSNFFQFLIDLAVDGYEPMPGAPAPRAEFRVVSPGYFEVMGIDVLRGREFTAADRRDGEKVVVINESMARAYFPDRDPIGRRIGWRDDLFERYVGVGKEWRRVVGVVADTRDRGLDAETASTVYHPHPQEFVVNSLVVRVSGEPSRILPAVREAILANEPQQPIVHVATIADLGDESVAPRRLNAMLLGAFASLALVIAAVGIGGVLAFSVGNRRREFGIRSALGATPRQVWSAVLAEGAVLGGVGVVLGAVAAVGLTRFIAGLLVGVPALDPVTFAAVGVLLGLVAIVAAWVPGWRAARVSPIEALRSE